MLFRSRNLQTARASLGQGGPSAGICTGTDLPPTTTTTTTPTITNTIAAAENAAALLGRVEGGMAKGGSAWGGVGESCSLEAKTSKQPKELNSDVFVPLWT